jgi:hypothetical protein
MTFINVIESPSSADLAVGRSEGKMLTAALDLAGLRYAYSLVENYSQFMNALGKQTVEAYEHDRVPVIHLSMHGSPEGLVLTDGRFLSWRDLNWKFRLINLRLNHVLIVCLSSCYGLSGLRMLRGETAHGILESQPPFRLLVSNLNPVPWSDAAIAFSTFYHLLERGKNPNELVAAMRMASGNDDFFGLMAGKTIDGEILVLGTEQLCKALDAVA